MPADSLISLISSELGAFTEFLGNTTTDDWQTSPSITSLTDGGFIVTWTSYGQDGSSDGVYGQRYDANGQTIGEEFQVNTYTYGNQGYTSITSLTDGGFVVTWISSMQDGDGYGIYGQRYDANGQTIGEEFQVNTTTIDDQEGPSVTSLSDGGFVVTWESNLQDGDGHGVFG